MSCYNLTDVSFAPGNKTFDCQQGIIMDAEHTRVITALNTIVKGRCEILPTVKRIESHAFYDCQGLTELVLPPSVELLGFRSVHECHNLQSVTMSEGLLVIEGEAFNGCRELTSVYVPNSVKVIGALSFAYCRKLEKVSVPEQATADRMNFNNKTFNECPGNLEIIVRQPDGKERVLKQEDLFDVTTLYRREEHHPGSDFPDRKIREIP